MKKKFQKIMSNRFLFQNERKSLMMFLFLLITFCTTTVLAQNGNVVKGFVTDEQGEPVIGALVVLKGNNSIGTATDINGNFSLSIPTGNQTLLISYIGMEKQEVALRGRTSITVVLKEDMVLLEEVVVVGYGQQKKESIVGSITQTSGKVLERAGGVSSVGAALTGNLPGVITTSSTGMPGEEDPQIVIRGRSSWNNSDPLILVDGIERPMTSIDINSVESISVLKDASATAVFGVKGANGVILITTKRGAEGKARIDIGVNATLKAPSQLPNKLDSYDALMLKNRAIEYELGTSGEGWGYMTPQNIINKYRNPANLTEAERYPNVDWADVLFKDYTMSHNANINISGGTKFVKYFASVDYLNEGDLFETWENNRGYTGGYGFNRVNARSNLDFQLTPTTTLKTNIFGSYGIKKGPIINVNEYNTWIAAYSTPPDVFLPVYSDGSWGYYPNDGNLSNSAQIISTSGIKETTTTRINTDFTLTQDLSFLLKGLNVQGMISWDNTFVEDNRGINDLYNDMQQKWINPVTGETTYRKSYDTSSNFDFQESVLWSVMGGEMSNWATQRNLNYHLRLNYGASFDKHDVTAMGQFSREQRATGSMIPFYREDWVYRLTYGFDSRYFIEYNGAYNGSEKFSPEYRFAFFQSGALGWLISGEKFMKKLTFIDMLKLRASIGQIGDDNIHERWLYMTQWAFGGNTPQGLNTGNNENSPYTFYRETFVGNPDVHWETVTKKNLGVDYSFLNGLISGSFDFFRDDRKDILIYGGSRSMPSYYGASAPVANLGKVEVKGYELELNFNKKLGNGLRLWANTNITHAVDKVIAAEDPELLPNYQKKAGYQIGQSTTHVGSGYYNTWDELYASTPFYETDNQKIPGNYYILDYNADGIIDANDQIPYGYSSTPQNTYNATLGFEYKGWSAFVQFYGVNNVSRQVVFTSFGKVTNNTAYDEGTWWSKDNVHADAPLPRVGTSISGMNGGNRYFYDGSYIRLKNAEIAYSFNSGWIRKIGANSLRIYLNGNNLWVWSRMPDDRESNFAGTGWASQGAYPTVKRFNLGLRITL